MEAVIEEKMTKPESEAALKKQEVSAESWINRLKKGLAKIAAAKSLQQFKREEETKQ